MRVVYAPPNRAYPKDLCTYPDGRDGYWDAVTNRHAVWTNDREELKLATSPLLAAETYDNVGTLLGSERCTNEHCTVCDLFILPMSHNVKSALIIGLRPISCGSRDKGRSGRERTDDDT